jgi:hypothetical protein
LNVGIGVLLNEQRGRGVAAENRQEAGRDILLAKPARYLRADLDETFAVGLNVQGIKRLAHRNGRSLEAAAMRPAANLTHFRNRKGRHLYVFISTRAKSAAAPSFAAKMPHRHKAREKIAFRPLPFLHFPAFARNMG